jgi:hypothetical protein
MYKKDYSSEFAPDKLFAKFFVLVAFAAQLELWTWWKSRLQSGLHSEQITQLTEDFRVIPTTVVTLLVHPLLEQSSRLGDFCGIACRVVGHACLETVR